MLLNPNRKKVALMILGAKKKPDFVQNLGEKSDTGEYALPEEDMPSDASAGLEAAADDIMRAIDKKDSALLMQSLKDFMYLCDEKEDMREGEED